MTEEEKEEAFVKKVIDGMIEQGLLEVVDEEGDEKYIRCTKKGQKFYKEHKEEE